jgi:hypothetical protein
MPFNRSNTAKTITYAQSPYVVSPNDDMLDIETTDGAVSIVIPAMKEYVKHHFFMQKTTSDANAATITIDSGGNINGSASYVLSAQYQSALLFSRPDGTYVTPDGGTLSGLTPGTAYANKPLVLGASKQISTITSATITNATIPNFVGAESHAGVITPVAGIAAAGGFSASPRGIWVGQTAPQVSTDFNNSTPVTTETYVSEIYIPCNMTITGIALFNGTDVTGNVTVGLATSAGAPITAAKSASTAGSGTDAIQRIPFAVAYAAVGPATYFIQVQYSSATARYNTFVIGNHGVLVQTGQTYGTLTSFTAPSTFVTAVSNVAGLY